MHIIYNHKKYRPSAFLNLKTDKQWVLDIQELLQYYLNSNEAIHVMTSGSTGNPKSISLSKSSIKTSARITNRYFNLNEKENALLCLPAKYIAGKLMIARAIEADVDLIIEEPSSTPLAELSSKIDFVAMTPFQIGNILENDSSRLNSVETIILGGGPVSQSLRNELHQVHPICFQTYGMTETITHIALQQLNGADKSDRFQVLDEFKISKDVRDCLVIKADHIHQGHVVTNDIVEILDHKSFKWLGRYDNVINTGGIKVYPEVIESKIQGIIAKPFFIIGMDDDKLGQVVTLCLESDPFDSDALLIKIKSKLDKFEIPRSILFFDCFQYTETGKIRRRPTLASR